MHLSLLPPAAPNILVCTPNIFDKSTPVKTCTLCKSNKSPIKMHIIPKQRFDSFTTKVRGGGKYQIQLWFILYTAFLLTMDLDVSVDLKMTARPPIHTYKSMQLISQCLSISVAVVPSFHIS